MYPLFKCLTAHRAVMKRIDTADRKLQKRHAFSDISLARSNPYNLVNPYCRGNKRFIKELMRQLVTDFSGRRWSPRRVPKRLTTNEYDAMDTFYQLMLERDRVLGMRHSLPDELVSIIGEYLVSPKFTFAEDSYRRCVQKYI